MENKKNKKTEREVLGGEHYTMFFESVAKRKEANICITPPATQLTHLYSILLRKVMERKGGGAEEMFTYRF